MLISSLQCVMVKFEGLQSATFVNWAVNEFGLVNCDFPSFDWIIKQELVSNGVAGWQIGDVGDEWLEGELGVGFNSGEEEDRQNNYKHDINYKQYNNRGW